MNEFLVIRLAASPRQTVSWVVVDQTGAVVGAAGEGELADALPFASGRQVVALVPAIDVLRTTADVPVKTGKILQAVPFALEEQLADDVDNLHFAVSNRDADGAVPVAVIRREKMEGWTGRFADAGLVPQRIYSESDAVAGMPNTATLLVQDDYAILAEPGGNVTAIDIDGVPGVLDLWLARREADAAKADHPPLHLVVYGSSTALDALESTWDWLRPRLESLEVRSLSEGALPRLAAQIVTTPGINLLQGSYAHRSSLMAYWPAWRAAALLVGALALLALVVQVAEIRQMRKEILSLDQSIEQAFHYVFPDAGPIQDARAQLSSRLSQLGDQSAGGSHEFLDALQIVAQAVNGTSRARIEAVNYRPGVMELRLRAPTVEALDRIQQSVTQAGGGLKAQIQSANAAGNEVLGRLQITRAGT